MSTLLFLDACPRGPLSRTRQICQAFMGGLGPDWEVEILDLTQNGCPTDPLLAADGILVGAPSDDFLFPACLKLYVERARPAALGRCRAQKAVYISACGGFIQGTHLGEDWARTVFYDLGIQRFYTLRAEGLYAQGADTESILAQAETLAREKAARLFP